ncbi:nitrogen fixation protein NifQ [Propionivibrio limicola]|uniref:nitrogen fixation protein NifQ n=1 Tax=Propionivibrio limicola TaxID=167645 RepID=UPI001290B689|nr:nitrogen fixation protein NifQ [Propionivibrio limicola]
MLNELAPPIHHSSRPAELATLAIVCVIDQSLRQNRLPVIRGLSRDGLDRLLDNCCPGVIASPGTPTPDTPALVDEFDDLVELLLEHSADLGEPGRWLVHAIATAAMGENHLWQDMGLPNRAVLSELMQTHFPALAARNVGDMKWKKFFYRQLCERADVLICKSPNCADCCDYRICFGPEN